MLLFVLVLSACNDASRDERVFDTLVQTVNDSDRWVGIHAAEMLLDLGYAEGIHEYFLDRLRLYADTPQYRIGIWRVLAQVAGSEDEKKNWVDQIIRVYSDTAQTDRLHAAESLAKLGVPLGQVASAQAVDDLEKGDAALRAYVTWGLSVTDSPDSLDMKTIFPLLSSENETERRIAAYALGLSARLQYTDWNRMALMAENEPSGSLAKVYLLKAAFVNAPDSMKNTAFLKEIKGELISAGLSSQKAGRYQMCQALAERGTEQDIPLLEDILGGRNQISLDLPGLSGVADSAAAYHHPWNTDVRAAAAYAILRVHQRVEKTMSLLDWLILVVYAAGMIAIGLYYSRKNLSRDDYHLGGRSMNSFLVGLSLFATLISSLSYMAYPGEMIKYGPVFFVGILALPLIYYVTGWFLIPRFMKLNMTNAYEILEVRIGRNVRVMGTFFFLSLRILWMATIIFAIVTIAIQSIFNLDPKYVPLICILLVVITVVYTSLGGMKAVVITDSVQTIIMFLGAILTVVTIGFHLGSLTDIIPSAYPVHWDGFEWGLDPTKRMTVANIILFYLFWYICTAGSDQMAIQRYMSTRDVRSARNSFGVSLITNLLVKIVLGLVGLALLAYFIRFPFKLPEGNTILENADSLFPRYILIGLPVGVTGLVVSGLLAAGMSSLSSGLISSTTIISGDLVAYFERSGLNNKKNNWLVGFIKQPRNTSIVIGILVVVLCMFVGYVEGNLLAVVVKVVNLFVAPLFVLFFMALFIPFATQAATLMAGIISVATAVAIAFFQVFGIQFLWIIPFAFVAGALTGVAISALERYVFRIIK